MNHSGTDSPSGPDTPGSTEDPRLPGWATELVSALDVRMGLELTEVDPERVRGRMPVAGNTQPLGLWHGGASCVLAESLGSIAAMSHARTLDRVAVGVDLNATHHRSTRAGWVHGTATPLRLGRSVTSHEIVLLDDAGARLCTARLTCQLITPG